MHHLLHQAVLASLALLSANAFSAPTLPPLLPPPAAPSPASAELNFSRGVPLYELSRGVLQDIMKVPFVLSQDILESPVRVGVSMVNRSAKDAEAILRELLKQNGFGLDIVGRIYYIKKIPPVAADTVTHSSFSYRPKARRVDSFAKVLPTAFPEAVFSFEKGDGSGNSTVQVFHVKAPVKEKSEILTFIDELDRPAPQVIVKAYLVEVSSDTRQARGVQVVSNLLGNKLSFQAGSAVSTNSIRFSVPSIDMLVSALDAESGFKTVASPALYIEHGEKGELLGGKQVPVLAATVSTDRSSAVSQSIEYRKTGTNLNITPNVIGDYITLDVDLEVSDAVATSTGVSSSPTLITSSATSRITVTNKTAVVMGGLISERSSTSENSLLGLLPFSREASRLKSETVLVLYAELVPPADKGAATAQRTPWPAVRGEGP